MNEKRNELEKHSSETVLANHHLLCPRKVPLAMNDNSSNVHLGSDELNERNT